MSILETFVICNALHDNCLDHLLHDSTLNCMQIFANISDFSSLMTLILAIISTILIAMSIFLYIKLIRVKDVNKTFKKKLRSVIRERDIGAEYYQLIAENITDVVWIYDLEKSEFSYISPSVKKFRGINSEAAIKQSVSEKFTAESYKKIAALVEDARQKEISDFKEPIRFEGEQFRPDGSTFITETYALPIIGKNGKITALKGVTHDISRQKQTEDELRSTERRLIDALENSKQILYRINYNTGHFDYISPYFLEITGLKLNDDDEKLKIENFIEIVHPEDRFMIEGRDFVESDFAEESKLSFMREYRIRLHTSEYHWFSDWSTLIFDSEQKVFANVGSLHDIDERMSAEMALRESESRFKSLAENINYIIARYDRNHRHIFVNSAISTIFPYSADQIIGKSFRDLGFSDDFCDQWELNVDNVFAAKNTLKGDIVFKGDNGSFHLDYVMYPEFDDYKNVINVVVNIRDVTTEKRTLDELKQIDLEYRLLFEYAHDAIFIEDSDENILNVNKSAVRLFGYTKDELLNMKTSDIVSPDMRNKGAHSLYTDQHTTEDRSFETYLISKSGKRIAANVALATFYVRGKRVIMSMVRDITSKKEAEIAVQLSEKKYKTLFATIKDGIIQTDLDGRIVDTNASFNKMLGYATDEVKNMRYFDLIPEQWQELVRDVVMKQIHERGFSDESEKAFIHKNGKHIPVLCSAWLVKENGNENAQMWGLIRDISQQKKSEEELRQAKEEAEHASKVKGDFLANMSHEIRTPMNGVIGMCNLLLRTDLNEEQQDYADSIRISADNLLKIINDILDISKIEAGKLELDIKEINLKKWLKRTNNIVAIKAQEKGLKLVSKINEGVPLVVYGDHLRLSQIVINLVSNAVKFTEKGKIDLIISKVEESEDDILLKFQVKDTGIGIPKEKIDQIFKSFSQVDTSAKRRYSGTGLGLAISKNITELMGGEIGVESELGSGSEFWFTARLKTHRQIDSQEEISEFMKKLRILVVDDGSPDGFIIRDQLSLLNCKFDEVKNTENAISILEKSCTENDLFKAVIVDSSIGEDVIEDFTSQVKSNKRLHNIVLILLKALGSRIKKHKENKAFDAILPKPVKFDDLNETLVTKLIQKTPEIMETTTVGLQDTHRLKDLKEELNIKAELSQKKKSEIKILLAEDNMINQKLAMRIITKLGYKVHAVENGKKAIEELVQNEYHMVFMDIQMPIMDGVEATRKIRAGEANESNINIPIIAMTAHAMKGDKERFISEGLTDYISKPIDIGCLTELLEKYAK